MLLAADLFYVYALCDPRKPLLAGGLPYEPFYIGKGKGQRVFKHFRLGAYEGQYNPYKSRKIASIRRSVGRDAAIVMVGWDLEEDSAFELEKRLVAQWGRRHLDPGGVLTNIKEGGRGSFSFRTYQPKATEKRVALRRGVPLTEAAKAKIREKATGRLHSAETCEKIRQIRLACTTPVSDATRQKLRELHLGKPKPDGFGEKIRQAKLGKPRPDNVKNLSKQVSMYSLAGELLGTYLNGREAQAQTGVNFKAVSACCTGRRRACWLGDQLVVFRFGSAARVEVLSSEAFRAAREAAAPAAS